MFNFAKSGIRNAKHYFKNSDQYVDFIKKSRVRSCHTLKVAEKPQTLGEKLAMKKNPDEFNIFEKARKHDEPFKAMKPLVINEIKNFDPFLNLPLVNDRIIELFENHLSFWDNIRALSIVATYEELAKDRGHILTDDELFDVYMLGWIFEIFESYSVLADDIVDDAPLRYGEPSWFYRNDRSPVASYDTFAMINFGRTLLNKYFKDKFYYYDIQRNITQCTLTYIWGQHTDVLIQDPKLFDMSKMFNSKVYHDLVPFKAGYNFSCPIDLGLHMNGIYDEEDGRKIYEVCRIAGCILQFWDDFKDYQKDIPEGKCSCIIARALDEANETQRKILLDNYGKKNRESVLAVLKIYKEMDVEKRFFEEEQKMLKAVEEGLQKVKNVTVRKIIINLAHTVHDYHF